MTSRRIPPDPVVDRLPDQAIRITVGIYVSTVSSEHLVPGRIAELQRRSQRRRWDNGSRNGNSRWTEAIVREMRRLHLIDHRSLADIAAMFDTHDSVISRIVRWVDWAHCDHDLRSLPRPYLRHRGPGLTPEVIEERRQRRIEYNRRYSATRRRSRAMQSTTCVACAHHLPKAAHCGLGIPEARSIHYANHCPAYAEVT